MKEYIGKKFIDRNKRTVEIIDIHTTLNLAGEVVKSVFVTKTHCMGQEVINNEVPKATIDRAIIRNGWAA